MNKHASELAKKRWEGKTEAEKSAHGTLMVEARMKKYGQKRKIVVQNKTVDKVA